MWCDGKTTMNLTRYFLFTKLRPKKEDYFKLVDESKKINAHVIYKTDTSDPDCKVLKGLIVLCGPVTHCNVLCNNFPNFILTTLPTNFELDFWKLPSDVFKIGQHPYEDIKKNLFRSLFSETSLSNFMSNERNPSANKRHRSMVPASAISTKRA